MTWVLFENEMEQLLSLPTDRDNDLITWTGADPFKAALVIAAHNSTDTGEIVLVRRLLNDWNN